MNKEVVKKYKAEFDYWLNGGVVYWTIKGDSWLKIGGGWDWEGTDTNNIKIVIKDKHFEARKAYALGEEIECRNTGEHNWLTLLENPCWLDECEYRPKPKTKTIVLEEWYTLREVEEDFYKPNIEWFKVPVFQAPYMIKKLSERTIEIEE